MIATKRHDYVPHGAIHQHPLIENHRTVSRSKVLHYKDDILRNGLLEPLGRAMWSSFPLVVVEEWTLPTGTMSLTMSVKASASFSGEDAASCAAGFGKSTL